MSEIRIKRVYEEPAAEDGLRVLVDRLWPRGLRKDLAKIDIWKKEVAPTPDLRKWFNHEPARWKPFFEAYLKELQSSEPAELFAEELEPHPVVSLLIAAKDPVHNHAKVLKQYLDNYYQAKSTK